MTGGYALPDAGELERAAEATGFTVAALERAAHMVKLAADFGALPELRGRLMLSGGAALHLCHPDPPRLPGDLDVTYLGTATGDALAADHAAVDWAVRGVLERAGLPAGCAWRNDFAVRWMYPFRSVAGDESFPVDLIAATPEPLWAPARATMRVPGTEDGVEVWVSDPYEAAGRKLATLFLRRRSRDLLDSHHILTHRALDVERLRIAFVVSISARPCDSRNFVPEWIGLVEREMRVNLVPYLRAALRAEAEADPKWGARLVEECREALSAVFPLSPEEREFIGRLRDHAEIRPELLTSDPELAGRISRAPELVRHAELARLTTCML